MVTGLTPVTPLTLPEFPQWQSFRLAWSRLIHPCPVLVVVLDDRLLFCWGSGQHWRFRSALLPDGACRDGVPLQREALGDFIADLIFDCDLPGAELVLCLPLRAAAWCVVDGYGSDRGPGLLPPSLQSLDLPFDLAESYITASPVQDALSVVGVPRQLIQGWTEVAEFADLPLRRVDWSLTAAQRALHQFTQSWHGDLAWLVVEQKSIRLLLIRQQVPEVDHALAGENPVSCRSEIRTCVAAWQARLASPSTLGWWLSVPTEQLDDWLPLVDAAAGESCLNQPLPDWSESSDHIDGADQDEPADVLSPLQHLALLALQEEER